MINTLPLLVTFRRDECYSQGERDLEFTDVARVLRFKGKAALNLQIVDGVNSSSAGSLMNRVTPGSGVQSNTGAELFMNYSGSWSGCTQ